MLLSNFAIQWYLNFYYLFGCFDVLMMIKKISIQWFWVDVTTKALLFGDFLGFNF